MSTNLGRDLVGSGYSPTQEQREITVGDGCKIKGGREERGGTVAAKDDEGISRSRGSEPGHLGGVFDGWHDKSHLCHSPSAKASPLPPRAPAAGQPTFPTELLVEQGTNLKTEEGENLQCWSIQSESGNRPLPLRTPHCPAFFFAATG